MLWADATEPTNLYGLIASAVVTLVGGSAGIWGYLQKRSKIKVIQERDSLQAERESNRATLNDAFREWKEIVADVKVERDKLKEDHKQSGIQNMEFRVRIGQLEEAMRQKDERIKYLENRLSQMEAELNALKGGGK